MTDRMLLPPSREVEREALIRAFLAEGATPQQAREIADEALVILEQMREPA